MDDCTPKIMDGIEICCEKVIDFILDDCDVSQFESLSYVPSLMDMVEVLEKYEDSVSMSEFTIRINGGIAPWDETDDYGARGFFRNHETCIPFFNKFLRNKTIDTILNEN